MNIQSKERMGIEPGFKRLLDYLFKYDNYNFISLVSVLFGGKKASRLCLSREFIEKLTPFVSKYRIHYSFIPRAKTKDAFPFESENSVNNYRLTEGDIKALKIRNHYFYLSYDANAVRHLQNAEISGEFEKMGLFFGYPDCCIKSYCSQTSVSDVSSMNNSLKNSAKKNDFSFLSNVCRQGKTIILHFPCSFDCKKTIRIGRRFFDSVNMLDKNYAKIYKEELTKAVFLSENFVINFQERRPEFNKETCRFFKKGIDAKRVSIIDENKIRLDGRAYGGALIYFK